MGNVGLSAYTGAATSPISAGTIANNAVLASGNEDNDGTAPNPDTADLEVQATFGTAPTAGAALVLYLVPALDGTNFGDGADSTVVPPATNIVGHFPVRAVTSAQRIAVVGVPVPPAVFRWVLRNDNTGQSAGSVTLRVRYYMGNAA